MRIELVSLAAATLTTVSFVPQAVKALRERDTHSLSFGMYSIFTVGVMLWGVYGWLRGDWAILIANVITGALCIAILIAKIRNDLLRKPSTLDPENAAGEPQRTQGPQKEPGAS